MWTAANSVLASEGLQTDGCRTPSLEVPGSGQKGLHRQQALVDSLSNKVFLPVVHVRGHYTREGSRDPYVSENPRLGLLEADPEPWSRV